MSYNNTEDESGREFSMRAEEINAYRVPVGKPEGKRPPG
jgi:hypothetical protein